MSNFDYLRHELTLNGPAEKSQIERLRSAYRHHLPEEYLAFLAAHDGAEGAVGRLVPADEVGLADDLYPGLDHLAGLVVFGSNGGLEAFAFDSHGGVLVVPWIGGREDAIPQGSFSKFVRRLVEERLFDREP